jgi:hypothetical protein
MSLEDLSICWYGVGQETTGNDSVMVYEVGL